MSFVRYSDPPAVDPPQPLPLSRSFSQFPSVGSAGAVPHVASSGVLEVNGDVSHVASSGVLTVNGDVISPDDPRLTPQYYVYYHSQRTVDPNLPPPLINWGAVPIANASIRHSPQVYQRISSTTINP